MSDNTLPDTQIADWPGELSGDVPARLSAAQYDRMVDVGILGEDDAVELLDGWIFEKRVIKPAHTLAVEELRDLLPTLLPRGWFANSQQPIALQKSRPEPDAAVIRGRRLDYEARLPDATAAEIGLVVEVADATLRRDRTIKQRIYAEAGIAHYWIINLVNTQTEVFSNPTDSGKAARYGQMDRYAPDQPVPLILNSLVVAQVDLRACFGLPIP